MRTRIAYINYTEKLRIFNILNYFCVVYLIGLGRLHILSKKKCDRRTYISV